MTVVLPIATAERDTKRYWWTLGLIVPTLPMQSWLNAQLVPQGRWYSDLVWFSTVFLVFVAIPIADLIRGTDDENMNDDVMAELKDASYYRYLVEFYLVLQYLTFGWAIWMFVNSDLSLVGQIGLSASVGVVGGIAINAAHELGHKPGKRAERLAQIALAQPFYGHFYVEHNRGHHRHVATPVDPASSRFGESLYAFLPRTVIGSLRSAWHLQMASMRRRNLPWWHRSNTLLQGRAMSVVLFGAAVAYAGTGIIWWLALQAVIGIFLLEVVNYLEHYGLCRQKLENGRYEGCQPQHSWNSNQRITNVFLYHLQRHSDHHANPLRPYQVLRSFEGVPTLPTGYAGMILLAMVPPAWRKVMDPKVIAHYDGDLSKANLTAKARRQLTEM